MTPEQTQTCKAQAQWITEHESTLKSLYKDYQKDTNDKNTTFMHFAAHMYGECKH